MITFAAEPTILNPWFVSSLRQPELDHRPAL